MEKARLCEPNPTKMCRMDEPGCSFAVDTKQQHDESPKPEGKCIVAAEKIIDKQHSDCIDSKLSDPPQSPRTKTIGNLLYSLEEIEQQNHFLYFSPDLLRFSFQLNVRNFSQKNCCYS